MKGGQEPGSEQLRRESWEQTRSREQKPEDVGPASLVVEVTMSTRAGDSGGHPGAPLDPGGPVDFRVPPQGMAWPGPARQRMPKQTLAAVDSPGALGA